MIQPTTEPSWKVIWSSLIPGLPTIHFVIVLQYAKTGQCEGLGMRLIWPVCMYQTLILPMGKMQVVTVNQM